MGSTIPGEGNTFVYIQRGTSTYEYSYDKTAWITFNTPTTITNTNTVAGNLNVEFISDLNFTSNSDYFICGSGYIQFGSSILRGDGTRPVITINNVSGGYPGLFQNGTAGADGYRNIYIYNLAVDVSNGSLLDNSGGWIGQQYFGKNGIDNYIMNCSSSGPISAAEEALLGSVPVQMVVEILHS